MCLNKPKNSNVQIKSTYIRVGENTNNSKYEFLKLFYTKWNQITKPSPRVIIDTHAGTGLVNLVFKNYLFKKKSNKLVYGSTLLAILKTLKISNNLKFIFVEPDNNNFLLLKKCINIVKKKGLPVFEKLEQNFVYKSLQTNRKRIKKQEKESIFPESFNTHLPSGYKRNWEKTKADILIFDKKIGSIIDKIIKDYLLFTDEKTNLKPKSLFFVDPCGAVAWNDVIKKICTLSSKHEGTDMILNWSWGTINRNLKLRSGKSILSKIYGIPLENINKEFEDIYEMEDFFKKYKDQLKQYFKFVVEVGVPKDRRLRPKLSGYKKYFLLLCTNNSSALSLAGYQVEKIKTKLRGKFLDMN